MSESIGSSDLLLAACCWTLARAGRCRSPGRRSS